MAAASVVANLTAMADENAVEHAAAIGRDHLGPALAALADKHEVVGEVRGVGVFWAVELVADRATKEPLGAAPMGALKDTLQHAGLLPMIVANRVHMVPPCVVTPEEVERAVALLDEGLAAL